MFATLVNKNLILKNKVNVILFLFQIPKAFLPLPTIMTQPLGGEGAFSHQ
jgi:hypothetical protein